MSKVQPLSAADLAEQLATVPGWTVRNGKLHRSFQFPDFVAAFGFMSQVALLAEAADHHPEWFNVYGTVEIDLVTHAADNQISQRDLALAAQIDKLLDA
jgi:4a-hydroxytetrahydrobiopterin dehydratase